MSSERCVVTFLQRALLALTLLSSTGSLAYAQDAEAADGAAYRTLIDQALSEFKHKNWPEARVLFRRAHELSPSARTLRGMGIVSYEMRDYVTAVLALSGALTDTRQPLTDAQRVECEQLLGRARTFVGSYGVSLTPEQAELSVDGVSASTRDGEGRLLLPLGEHTLRAAAEGYLDATMRLTVQGGEQGDLRIALKPPAAVDSAQASSVGSLAETSSEQAPSVVPTEPAPARRTRGGLLELRYSWLALGATAVFGGIAAGTWYAGKTKLDDLDASCARAASRGAPCRRGAVDTAEVKRFERLTNAMLGLGGAALIATGIAMVLEWPRERAPEPARLTFDVTDRELVVRGTF